MLTTVTVEPEILRYPGRFYIYKGVYFIPQNTLPYFLINLHLIPLLDRAPSTAALPRPHTPSVELRYEFTLTLRKFTDCLIKEALFKPRAWTHKATKDETALISKSSSHRIRLSHHPISSELLLDWHDYTSVSTQFINSFYSLVQDYYG